MGYKAPKIKALGWVRDGIYIYSGDRITLIEKTDQTFMNFVLFGDSSLNGW